MLQQYFALVYAVFVMMTAAGAAPAMAEAEFVGSDACVACHQDEYEAWQGSHHAAAWTMPSEDTIVADFNNTRFEHDGMTALFSRDEDGAYMVDVIEKDGSQRLYEIHSVAGIEPLQQYLLQTRDGVLQSFDVVWDTEEQEWYHLYPDQDLPPDDGLHWSGVYKSWDARCAECHATDFTRNYDRTTRSYSHTFSEIGVGCEACHGPAQTHVTWAEGGADPDAKPDNYGFSAVFDTRDQIMDQCAGCHSRREALQDGNPLPGAAYHDAYNLSVLRQGLYHADGQILDEVYVYGSFLQSEMYEKGVGCQNCHNPHSGDLIAEGQAICTQCHSLAGNPDFPTLKRAEYDVPEHTNHPEGSGVECKHCHMIDRPYMGVDWRRDHSFRVPRPDLGARIGAPDACTDCHTDQTQDWAAGHIEAWFPDSAYRGEHFGDILFAGRQNPAEAAGDLLRLSDDMEQPAIARATAVYLLQNAPLDAGQMRRVTALLRDGDPLVRAQATRLQERQPERQRVGALVPLLSDQYKNVRSSAARSLFSVNPALIRGPAAERFRAAFLEWQSGIQARFDFPETHLVLGGFALTARNLQAAEQSFAEATTLDPQRTDAWRMRVRIAQASGDNARAEELLREALELAPEDPGLVELKPMFGME